MAKDHRNAFCSYCRKSYVEVGPLIEGPGDNLYICSDCVDLCRSILDQEARRRKQLDPSLPQISTFQRLQQRLRLCLDVEAKSLNALFGAIDRHAKSLSTDETPARSLILLAGPSAASSLFVARLIASAIDAMFWPSEGQRIVRTGGLFVRNSELDKIVRSSDFNLEVVHKSIVHVNSCDDRTVQVALSRMIHSRDGDAWPSGLDPGRILFLCHGTFPELDKIAARHAPLLTDEIDFRDLIEWGVLPDLVERLHVALWWHALDEHTLQRIASVIEVELPNLDGI